MAPKIIAENQISVTIPTQPSTSFFPSIRPIWVIRSPEKEGTNSRIPSISFLRISGSALKRLSDGQERQDEQGDDRKDARTGRWRRPGSCRRSSGSCGSRPGECPGRTPGRGGDGCRAASGRDWLFRGSWSSARCRSHVQKLIRTASENDPEARRATPRLRRTSRQAAWRSQAERRNGLFEAVSPASRRAGCQRRVDIGRTDAVVGEHPEAGRSRVGEAKPLFRQALQELLIRKAARRRDRQ